MLLTRIDWIIIFGYFAVSLLIGLYASRNAGKNISEFFAAGRNMPWWLLGVSMVATTFSLGTPSLVTNLIRDNGVAANWTWWAFLLTGMLTVFVYAHLWKRLGVLTDIEFYELRYSGKLAAFLRGFRAIYMGLIFEGVLLAGGTLSVVKLGTVLLGISPVKIVIIVGAVTVIYTLLGGLKAVILTDFFQFILAMTGSVAVAVFALHQPEVGGLPGLLSHRAVLKKINMLPDFSDPMQAAAIFIIPLAVQWWGTYYPGAEPGGGGFIAQRMFAAKDENNSVASVFFFNVMHYGLRPWPWIIAALCSIIVFPSVASMKTAFPHAASYAANDLAYPAMLSFLPPIWMGITVASLAAAYMSTVSTLLNLASSYLVNDFYKRFVRPESSPKEQVLAGRLIIVILMAITGFWGLHMKTAVGVFQIVLQIGAGTGLVFILRWFWWRVNAASEIAAMAFSLAIAIYFKFIQPHYPSLPSVGPWAQVVVAVIIATIGWLVVTFLTRPTSPDKLIAFCKKIRPGGPGWSKVREQARKEGEVIIGTEGGWSVPQGILCMLLGVVSIYGVLLGTGYWIYGSIIPAAILTVVAAGAAVGLFMAWKKLKRIRAANNDTTNINEPAM